MIRVFQSDTIFRPGNSTKLPVHYLGSCFYVFPIGSFACEGHIVSGACQDGSWEDSTSSEGRSLFLRNVRRLWVCRSPDSLADFDAARPRMLQRRSSSSAGATAIVLVVGQSHESYERSTIAHRVRIYLGLDSAICLQHASRIFMARVASSHLGRSLRYSYNFWRSAPLSPGRPTLPH